MADQRSTVYLDHAATTPMVPEAIEAMTAQLSRRGNPSSLHAAGREARRVVEDIADHNSSPCRRHLARCRGADAARGA